LDGKISLANSTLFANQAKGGSAGCNVFSLMECGQGGNASGGGLHINRGSLSLTGDTVASNQVLATLVEKSPPGSSFGGGIANAGATSLVTDNTLIGNNTQDSGNADHGDDVSGALTSSFSLIGQTAGATITDQGSNIFNVDPLLDPGGLKGNGGPTQTVALEFGSPAIDAGDNALCAAAEPSGLGGVDQRGYSRFPHGDNHCDIGAFEFRNLLVHPKVEHFGSQPVGQQGQSRNLFITNNQTASVTLSTKLGGSDPVDFIENDNCGATLAANASCTIALTFKPVATGDRSATLSVSDSPDRTSPYTIGLVGEGK
jgi:centrosomal CEP192-like protein